MNKKTKLAILGVIALVLVTLSLTYAYWLVTRTQDKENVITAGCLDISLTNEQNDINLTEQFPLSDEEGESLTPYAFTITNNCNTSVDYNVNLEVLGDKDSNIQTTSIKAMLNENSPTILGYNYEENPTIEGAYTSYRLGFGTLAAKGSADYTLRLWLDADAPISEMNKTFSSQISVTIGQGINNPLKEGTLAYDLVSQYNGKESATMLNAKWEELEPGEEKARNIGKGRSYYWGSGYTFDDTTGKYTLSGDVVEDTVEECRDGTKKCGKYTLLTSSSASKSDFLYTVISFTSNTDLDNESYNYITIKQQRSQNVFGAGGKEGEASIHTTPDDYGISYYLRGVVTNNYVEFGTYAKDTTITSYDDNLDEVTEEVVAGTPMYWRIVRINGDGTIRLIYDGTSKKENGTDGISDIGLSAYNTEESEAKHAGYTYVGDNEEEVDSTIKEVVDTWYEDHLKTNYEKYIADRIFCNDRENVTDELYMTTIIDRFYDYSNPKLSCTRDEDKYTVDSNNGNGYLTNPVGLITADEAMFSGASVHSYGKTYLSRNNITWTMTPDIENYGISAFFIGFDGSMDTWTTVSTDTLTVRPVINLKADVAFTGDGSYETPYVITTN